MRKRKAIEDDGALKDILKLEVLLDIRDLLTLAKPVDLGPMVIGTPEAPLYVSDKPKVGRPKGSKNKKST